MDLFKLPHPPLHTLRRLQGNQYWVAIQIGVIALLFRLPYFFPETLNWDESTFIIMGQSILDGHLPYTQLWDLKPFLAFLHYAIFLVIFGKNIWGIRLAGLLCLSISAFFCYCFAKKVLGTSIAALSAIFVILVVSSIPGGQATMTEIIALPYLCAALYCLSNYPRKRLDVGLGALLLALAVNIRPNLIIVAIGLSLYLLVDRLLNPNLNAKSIGAILQEQGLYYVSGAIASGILIIPYLYTGNFERWWQTNIQGALAYASSGRSMGALLQSQVLNLISTYNSPAFWLLGSLTWGGAILSLIALPYWWRRLSKQQRSPYSLFLVCFTLTLLSIVRGGMDFPHYLIQLAPFIAVLSAQFLFLIISHPPKFYTLKLYAAVAIILGSIVTALNSEITLWRYRQLERAVIQKRSLPQGNPSQIVRYLQTQGLTDTDTIYVVNTKHIIYWLAGKQPPIPCVTHPSVLVKHKLLPYCSEDGEKATPVSELKKILALRPRYIIQSTKPPFYMRRKQGKKTWAMLQKELQKNYYLANEFGKDQVYARVE